MLNTQVNPTAETQPELDALRFDRAQVASKVHDKPRRNPHLFAQLRPRISVITSNGKLVPVLTA